MKKTPKKLTTRPASKTRASASQHPYQNHLDRIRSVVHSELASAGVTNLALRSMEFGPAITCPDGQHLAKVCTTDSSGRETCVWKCVPN
jgi:hypothetical protein